MTTHNHTIPDRSPPGSTRTAPSAVHHDGGVKCATGASSKIRGRDNITIGTWNTRTLRPAGKLQELTHEMDRYRWNILGLCKMRWKNFGETTTEEGHKVFFSGKEDKHEHGVGFLVHKGIVNTVAQVVGFTWLLVFLTCNYRKTKNQFALYLHASLGM